MQRKIWRALVLQGFIEKLHQWCSDSAVCLGHRGCGDLWLLPHYWHNCAVAGCWQQSYLPLPPPQKSKSWYQGWVAWSPHPSYTAGCIPTSFSQCTFTVVFKVRWGPSQESRLSVSTRRLLVEPPMVQCCECLFLSCYLH